MKIFLIILFSTLLLSCKGLVIGGVDIGKAVDITSKAVSDNEINQEQEVVLGEQMTSIILGASTLHPDKNLQTYVNRVGQWVAMQSERTSLHFYFAVVDTQAINAFAMPGGYIIVTSGLIDLLDNEAELAAVLAHEIAHVNFKHHVKAIEKAQSATLLTDLALFAGDVYQAKEGSSDYYQNRAIAESLFNTTTTLYSKGLERDDEFHADSSAVTLLARSGYDPYAMAQVLQKLSVLNADDSNLQLLFNSHPHPTDRLSSIENTYDRLTLSEGEILSDRFKMFVK